MMNEKHIYCFMFIAAKLTWSSLTCVSFDFGASFYLIFGAFESNTKDC